MNEYINKYLDYLKYEKKLSEITYLSYKFNLDMFSNYLDGKNILSLNTDDIRKFLYQEHFSSRTRAHYLTVINSFYDYLISENILKSNPCDIIKLPKIEKKLPKFLTCEEVDKLLNLNPTNALEYRNSAMLETIYACGLRVSELTDLKLNNIDFDECIIRIMGKGS